MALDWKWLFIYPDQGIAAVNQLVIPAGTPIAVSAHLGDGDEFVLRAAARQPDLHDGRHDHAPQPSRGPAGRVSRLFGKFQRRRLFRDAVHRQVGARRRFQCLARAGARRRDPPSTLPATPNWQSRAKPCRRRPIARSNRSCSNASSIRRWRVPQRRAGAAWRPPAHRQEVEMLGKLTWAAIPFNEPLPLIRMGGGRHRHSGHARVRHHEGLVALSVARVADQRRPQAHRRHVHGSRRWSCCCAAFPMRS